MPHLEQIKLSKNVTKNTLNDINDVEFYLMVSRSNEGFNQINRFDD